MNRKLKENTNQLKQNRHILFAKCKWWNLILNTKQIIWQRHDYWAHINVLKTSKQMPIKSITSSHELEASGSDDWILLFKLPLLAVSTRPSERVLSMLSVSLSKRIAAITESNFKDCKQLFCINTHITNLIHSIKIVTLYLQQNCYLWHTAERAVLVIALTSSFPVQTLGIESESRLNNVANLLKWQNWSNSENKGQKNLKKKIKGGKHTTCPSYGSRPFQLLL